MRAIVVGADGVGSDTAASLTESHDVGVDPFAGGSVQTSEFGFAGDSGTARRNIAVRRSVAVVEEGEYATVGADVAIDPRGATAEETVSLTRDGQVENRSLTEGRRTESTSTAGASSRDTPLPKAHPYSAPASSPVRSLAVASSSCTGGTPRSNTWDRVVLFVATGVLSAVTGLV